MICYICQKELEKKEVIRGVKQCDTVDCKNVVGYWYRACKVCSKEYNECEVCRVNLEGKI